MNEILYLYLVKYAGVYATAGLVISLTCYAGHRFDSLERKIDEKFNQIESRKIDRVLK